MQLNSSMPISVGLAIDKVNNHKLGVGITIHIHHTLSVPEMWKSLLQTLRARVQRHLSLSYVIINLRDVIYFPLKYVYTAFWDTLYPVK